MVDFDRSKLSLTIGDNVMGPDKVALITSIMVCYETDVAKWIIRETRDWATNIDTFMDLNFMLTQIYLDAGVPELLGIDQFLRPKTTTDIGLIKDIANQISKKVTLVAAIIEEFLRLVGMDMTSQGSLTWVTYLL